MTILEIIGLLYISITLLAGFAILVQEWRGKEFKEWIKTRKQ